MEWKGEFLCLRRRMVYLLDRPAEIIHPGLHIESDLHFSLLLVSSPALSFLLPFLFNPGSGLLPVIINFWEEK